LGKNEKRAIQLYEETSRSHSNKIAGKPTDFSTGQNEK